MLKTLMISNMKNTKKKLYTLITVLMIALMVVGCGREKVENKVITLLLYGKEFTGTYTGEVKGDKPDGNGVFKFQNENSLSYTYTGGFKNGKVHGKFIMQYGANAVTKEKVGVSKQEGVFKEGVRDGQWKEYHRNGKVYQEINFKDGKENGIWKVYYQNGQLSREFNFKDGKRIGIGKAYYQNGQLAGEVEFPNGKGKEFYEDGQLMYEGEFKNGKHDGQGTWYNQNGSINYQGKFVNGNPAK